MPPYIKKKKKWGVGGGRGYFLLLNINQKKEFKYIVVLSKQKQTL